MNHPRRNGHEDDEPEIRHFPEGTTDQSDPEHSVQQASPSLRSMAASACTFEGKRERGFASAEMASMPGWRGRVIKILAIAGLLLLVVLVLASVFGH
ncbi:MAG: hypothetical protein ABI468_08195 [Candidatus Nanopelagicales bacterium]